MIDYDALHGAVQDAFAEPVTYTPFGGSPITIMGVFDEAYAEVETVNGPLVATLVTTLGVRLDAFGATAPAQGDTLVIERTGERYVVANVQPDGKRWAILHLNARP